MMKRFILVVLDSFGIGYMDDTKEVRPQDLGANTCLHILEKLPDLHLPNLERLGLINSLGQGAGTLKFSSQATFGTADLTHFWADTFYGHQEIMGTKPQKPDDMPFSRCIDHVAAALTAAGYQVEYWGPKVKILLVNGCVTVGDNIEADLGQVFNITGALDYITFQEVLHIGKVVRSVVRVPRVIALGGEGITAADLLNAVEEKEETYIGVNCPRSGVYNKGYQVIHLGYGINPEVQIPTILGQQGIDVVLLGKVADIVENRYGISKSCVDTASVMELTLKHMCSMQQGFIATNVQETDLAGHAENVALYAEKLAIADKYLGLIMKGLVADDILMVMADHGNDPAIGHSHHTRERVPLLVSGPQVQPGCIGHRSTLSDVGATVAEYFCCKQPENGQSFLHQLLQPYATNIW
jgi:phosphopentomutase